MRCPECHKEVVADRFFCTWCEVFIPQPLVGKKAGLFRRWFATAIDPLLGLLLYFLVSMLVIGIIGGAEASLSSSGPGPATVFSILIVTVGYGIFYLNLLSHGMTPGKWLLGEKVVNKEDGGFPGLGRMLLREIIGKFVSGLFLGIGYFWAIFDKDQQAWHDKIASTVVVKVPPVYTSPEAVQPASLPARPDVALQLPSSAWGSYCPNCGAAALPDSKFCSDCGTALT